MTFPVLILLLLVYYLVFLPGVILVAAIKEYGWQPFYTVIFQTWTKTKNILFNIIEYIKESGGKGREEKDDPNYSLFGSIENELDLSRISPNTWDQEDI